MVLNVTVMALNEGMPVSSWALGGAGLGRTMDVARGHFYKHSAMTVHTRLRLLGDIVPFRLMRTVLSPGDLLMLVGIAAMTWAATQPSPARRSDWPIWPVGHPASQAQRAQPGACSLRALNRHNATNEGP